MGQWELGAVSASSAELVNEQEQGLNSKRNVQHHGGDSEAANICKPHDNVRRPYVCTTQSAMQSSAPIAGPLRRFECLIDKLAGCSQQWNGEALSAATPLRLYKCHRSSANVLLTASVAWWLPLLCPLQVLTV